MWLKKAVIQEGEQGCIQCANYAANTIADDWMLWCSRASDVYKEHGLEQLHMWVTTPESPNDCSLFSPDPTKILNYKYKKWSDTRVTGSKNMWLKIAEDQMKMGVAVEKEHAPTVAKIKASIKDGKITMTDEEIYKSIAEDHILGEKMPDYYSRLKNMEEEARKDYAK